MARKERYDLNVLVAGDSPGELENAAFAAVRELTGDSDSALEIGKAYRIHAMPRRGSTEDNPGNTSGDVLALMETRKKLYANVLIVAWTVEREETS
jgi:hypothetical protein